MAFERERPSPGEIELRPDKRGLLATGTLACPRCDVPVAIEGTATPASPLACPFCGQAGALRDFLSLEPPARPARVQVRVVPRPRRPARSW